MFIIGILTAPYVSSSRQQQQQIMSSNIDCLFYYSSLLAAAYYDEDYNYGTDSFISSLECEMSYDSELYIGVIICTLGLVLDLFTFFTLCCKQ